MNLQQSNYVDNKVTDDELWQNNQKHCLSVCLYVGYDCVPCKKVGTRFHRKVPLFLQILKFPYNM